MSKRFNAGNNVLTQDEPPKPGKASSYIDEFEIRPGMLVVLVARVSTGRQDKRNNLRDQLARLRRTVEEFGGKVVGVFWQRGSGQEPEAWLGRVAAYAQKRNAVILAESVDRFVRSKFFNTKTCPNARASEAELKWLQLVCGEVRLMTVVHPDASLREVKSYHTIRGQQEKGRKGGRPRARKPGDKKKERVRRMRHVLEYLWVENSRRRIAKLMNLHLTQVQRIVDQIRAGGMRTHLLIKKKLLDVKSL